MWIFHILSCRANNDSRCNGYSISRSDSQAHRRAYERVSCSRPPTSHSYLIRIGVCLWLVSQWPVVPNAYAYAFTCTHFSRLSDVSSDPRESLNWDELAEPLGRRGQRELLLSPEALARPCPCVPLGVPPRAYSMVACGEWVRRRRCPLCRPFALVTQLEYQRQRTSSCCLGQYQKWRTKVGCCCLVRPDAGSAALAFAKRARRFAIANRHKLPPERESARFIRASSAT